MKLNTSKEVWIARIIAWVLLCVLASGILFVTTFMIGPSLFVIPNFSERIAVAMYCPGAESTSLQEGASGPTTSDPNGTQGHTVEITCYFPDGSTDIIDNGEFAVAALVNTGLNSLTGVTVTAIVWLLLRVPSLAVTVRL